jgi:hypothetical protein
LQKRDDTTLAIITTPEVKCRFTKCDSQIIKKMYKPLANFSNKNKIDQSTFKPKFKRHSHSNLNKYGKMRKRYNNKQRVIHRYIRIGIGLATGLISGTAIAGGVSMFGGSDEYGFPSSWLEGTIFSSYLIPSLALGVLVGGSCLAASITNFSHKKITLPLSIIAGIMLCCFVLVETIVLKNVQARPIGLEIFYFFWGMAILLCSTYLYAINHIPSK